MPRLEIILVTPADDVLVVMDRRGQMAGQVLCGKSTPSSPGSFCLET